MMQAGKFLCIILLMSAICSSCKSPKNTEASTRKDYAEVVGRYFAGTDSLIASLRAEQEKILNRVSDLKVENTTTYYTLPDSTGRQYTAKTSTTTVNNTQQETETTHTELNATLQRLYQRVDSLSKRVDAALKEQQKAVELSWWDLHKWKVIVPAIIIALIVVGIMIYKLKKGG